MILKDNYPCYKRGRESDGDPSIEGCTLTRSRQDERGNVLVTEHIVKYKIGDVIKIKEVY